MQHKFDRRYLIVTVIVVAIIIYGSLFPFDFHKSVGGAGAIGTLIRTWNTPPSGLGDFVANILLYLPLGFFGFLSLPDDVSGQKRFWALLLAGFALCLAMEWLQHYDQGRVSRFSDVYLNTAGTALGGLAGSLIGANIQWPLLREISAARFPVLLFSAWLGYSLFPYVPTLDVHKYWDALKPIVLTPSLAPYHLFRYVVVWLIICGIVEAIARQNRSRFFVPIVIAGTFGAKIIVVNRVLSLAEVVGAVLAMCVWLMLLTQPGRTRSIAVSVLLGALIVAQRLEPFQFSSTPNNFGWIPFLGFMQGSIEVNIQSFLEKFFLYGSMLWFLTDAGMRLRWSTVLVSATLLVTSVCEVYLPGRSAEITDAILVLIASTIFALFTSSSARDVTDTPRRSMRP